MRDSGVPEKSEVLVVGGGLTGLSAAVFLARQGVTVTVVERHSGALRHPRARSVNPRTAEILGQAGVLDTMTGERGYESQFPAAYLLRARTLAGPETGRVEQRPPVGARDGRAVSPASWGLIDQDRLEAVLHERAELLGAEVRFGQELTALAQDAEGVTARIRDHDGRLRAVRAAYVIGADGHTSRVRELLGVELIGPGTLGHVVSMVFDADLTGPLRGRHAPERGHFMASCHVEEPAPGTVLFPHGQPHRWVFNTPLRPERGECVEDFDDARCAAAIRAGVGDDSLAPALVPQLADGTKVLGYRVAAAVADSYGSGRVLLAGDAAHVMPPTGAFGAGTGIQDAHNLAWKLAAVLRGGADPDLLTTYQTERLPVAELTLGQALLLMRQRGALTVPLPSVPEPVPYDAMVFGYRYRSAAVVDTEGEDADVPALPPERLTGQPGTRAPHVPLPGDAEGSVLDWFGRGFVLAVAEDSGPWHRAAVGLSDRDLTVRVLDARGAAAYGVTRAGAVLVRPDGFVGWRSRGERQDAGQVLAHVLDRVGCGATTAAEPPAVR